MKQILRAHQQINKRTRVIQIASDPEERPAYDEQPAVTIDPQISPNEEDGQKKPPNDWHSMMYLMLRIAFHKFGKNVQLDREVVIGAMPPRADFLLTLNDLNMDLELQIFKIFLKLNIIEFKSPDDDLGVAELWQTAVYFCALVRDCLLSGKGTPDDFTITLIRDAKPEKMFHELGDCVVPDPVKGIYHVKNWKIDVPIQIIVTRELEGPEYAGFRAISKHSSLEDISALLEEGEKAQDDALKSCYRDFVDLLSKLNPNIIRKIKRRYPGMYDIWKEVFADEIAKDNIKTAVNIAFHAAKDYGDDDAGAIRYAAKTVNVTPAYVSELIYGKPAV